MVSQLGLILSIAAAAIITFVVVWLIMKMNCSKKVSELSADLQLEKNNLESSKGQIAEKIGEIEKLTNEIKNMRVDENTRRDKESEIRTDLERERARLDTSLREQRSKFQEQIDLLNKAKEQMKQEFENLAQKILDEKGKKFSEQSQETLGAFLNPFREQLKDFKEKVEKVYDDEDKRRFSLQEQIEKLQTAHKTLSDQASDLVHALKADTKTQGNWGEINLRRILEYTGMVEGKHFLAQASFKDEAGRNLRPDVVVNLPDGKQVIVDSKVSLTGYERYMSAEGEDEKKDAVKAHLTSIRNHINELSAKNYEDIEGINSLNFVLMFIPVEPAYFIALQNDQELIKLATEKKVLIVCPTTLLISLYLVHNLWQLNSQNLNAKEIAKRGAYLLEKFNGFVNSLEDVEKNLGKATESCGDAMKKLKTGRGNLVFQAQTLLDLGVKKPKKANPALLSAQNEDENDEENIREEPEAEEDIEDEEEAREIDNNPESEQVPF